MTHISHPFPVICLAPFQAFNEPLWSFASEDTNVNFQPPNAACQRHASFACPLHTHVGWFVNTKIKDYWFQLKKSTGAIDCHLKVCIEGELQKITSTGRSPRLVPRLRSQHSTWFEARKEKSRQFNYILVKCDTRPAGIFSTDILPSQSSPSTSSWPHKPILINSLIILEGISWSVIAVETPWLVNNSSVTRNVFGGGDVFSAGRLLTTWFWRTGNGSKRGLWLTTKRGEHPLRKHKDTHFHLGSSRER